jgi:carbohydrate kinase (thermoresistant glucokinase family)
MEGDSLHPQSNIEKMTRGIPLTDEDRAPWLLRVAGWVSQQIAAGECGVITCSALKRSYRDLIARHDSGVEFVLLDISRKLAAARLAARHDHFMPSTLLDSQFADLDPPSSDESAITVDASRSPTVVVAQIVKQLGLRAADTSVGL